MNENNRRKERLPKHLCICHHTAGVTYIGHVSEERAFVRLKDEGGVTEQGRKRMY